MIAPTRVRALGIAVGAVLCLALGFTTAAGAAETISYESESLQNYEQQLAGGQIREVVVNKRIRSLRITLENGKHVKTRYAAKHSAQVIAAIRAKGVPVRTLTPAEAEAEATTAQHHTHHKIRYIVGGVLIAVVVIVGGLLLFRRRRAHAAE